MVHESGNPAAIDVGPFATFLGIRLTAVSAGELRATWAVTESMLQPHGLLHGGVHCSVIETLASVGAALWLGAQGRVVGVSNTTDFYRACAFGDRLTSVARPVHRGRSRQVWRVETFDDRERLVSAGQVGLQNLT